MSLGTDFSMPGDVEDGYSAAMAGIAALQLDNDTFGTATSTQDSMLGMLSPTSTGTPSNALPSAAVYAAFQQTSNFGHQNRMNQSAFAAHGASSGGWTGNGWDATSTTGSSWNTTSSTAWPTWNEARPL